MERKGVFRCARGVLIALSMTACAAETTPEGSAASRTAAIVGGQLDEKHVAVFDILVENEQSCTGTLISPHAVLTAAHCIVEDVNDARELVVFTGPDEAKRSGGKLHKVAAGKVYPTWEKKNPDDDTPGDLAVLILEEPSTVSPMRYNRTPLDGAMKGSSVKIVGYGDTTVKDPTSGGGQRRQASVPLTKFDNDWVVVGKRTVTQCYGDSGGPVLMSIDGVEQIIGVNSWQDGDDCNVPNYNTRVDRLTKWIDEQVQLADPGFKPTGGAGSDAGSAEDGGGAPSAPVGGGQGDDGHVPNTDAPSGGSNGGTSRESEGAGSGCQLGTAPARGHGLALVLIALACLPVIRRLRSKAMVLRRTTSPLAAACDFEAPQRWPRMPRFRASRRRPSAVWFVHHRRASQARPGDRDSKGCR